MICNPMLNAQANPFEAWQKLWLQGLQSTQPQAPQAAMQPVDLFSQFATMQNTWLSAFVPQPAQTQTMPAMQAPKITVTTIELGDMRPYMEMASQMLAAWQPLMQPMFNQMLAPHNTGGRR